MKLAEIKMELKSQVFYNFTNCFKDLIQLVLNESPYLDKLNNLQADFLILQKTEEEHKNIKLNELRFKLIRLIDKLRLKDLELQQSNWIGFAWSKHFIGELPKPKEKKNTGRKRVLCFAANPKDTKAVRVYGEMRDIANELFHHQSFEFIPVFATRKKELRKSFHLYQPQIVHFAGHGNEHGIYIEDDDNNGELLTSDKFADFIRGYANDIECVFLNSCFSQKQGNLLRQHIGNVIGTVKAVKDPNARKFSKLFYEGLAIGSEATSENIYLEAYNYAIKGLPLDDFPNDEIPVIL